MKENKLERFDTLNEKTDGAKAIAAGYNYGDTVYNNIMKKYVTIADRNRPTWNYDDKYCSLAAVGANPNTYSKDLRSKGTIKTEWSTSEKGRKQYETAIEKNIKNGFHNSPAEKPKILQTA